MYTDVRVLLSEDLSNQSLGIGTEIPWKGTPPPPPSLPIIYPEDRLLKVP